MRLVTMTIATAAVCVLLTPTVGFAQAGTQQPARPAAPPATAPATPPAAAPAPKPPAPFPEGAKFAFIDIQYVAGNSAEGKAATAKIDALRKKKTDELSDKNKALQTAQTKLQQGG